MSENTNDYEPYNAIVEPAISDITDSVPLPVKTGAQTYSWNKIAAETQSNNIVRFNIPVNSTHLIQREVYVSGQLQVEVRLNKARTSLPGVLPPVYKVGDAPELRFGETDAVRPFFFNQMIQNIKVDLGSNSFNLPQRDIFDGMLKILPKKFLSRWNSQTASYIDNSFKNYIECKGTLNNPLQGFEDSISSAIFNGAYPIEISNIEQYKLDGTKTTGANKNSQTVWDTDSDYLLALLTLEVNEPLFINPFISNGDIDQHKAALYGLNNINIEITLTGNANHMFCRGSDKGQVVNYNLSKIAGFTFNYISMTPQLNQILPIKSVYPFKKIDRFISNPNQRTVDKYVKGPNSKMPEGTINSASFNFGSIPDYIVIYVRDRRNNQKLETASSSFLPIKKLRIQINNNDNLLSSLNAVDLWKLSVKNGSSQTFYEFKGVATTATANAFETKNTIGSVVILSATDLNLQSPLAPGTLSNILFNASCEFYNNEPNDVEPELIVMPISNGIMTIANGVVHITNTLFYESNNAAVLSNNSVPIKQDLAYSSKQGGNLSTLIATKLNKSLQGKSSGSGLRSAGNAGSSLFY